MKGLKMLHYAAVFFVIALVAGLLGFTGIAAGAVGIAKILFFVFIVLQRYNKQRIKILHKNRRIFRIFL